MISQVPVVTVILAAVIAVIGALAALLQSNSMQVKHKDKVCTSC